MRKSKKNFFPGYLTLSALLVSALTAKTPNRFYALIGIAGIPQIKQLDIFVPQPACLSKPYDPLLFHGVSGEKFRIKKYPSCEREAAAITAKDLAAYQNFLHTGGLPSPIQNLPRWARDTNWVVLGFLPLSTEIILVELEHLNGDYRAFYTHRISVITDIQKQ